MDGFPRTVAQAEELERRLSAIAQHLNAVIYLNVPEAELLRRLSGRRTCSQCNAIYQIHTMAPEVEGVCDRCGGALVQRADEKEDVVRNRLEVYSAQTEPLLAYYRDLGLLYEIDGTIGVENVMAAIRRVLDGMVERRK